MKRKKGFYFSLDAFFALAAIVTGILLLPYLYTQYAEQATIVYVSKDLTEFMSTTKIGEVNNSYVQSLITAAEIEDLNVTIAEQITRFWILGKQTEAQNIIANLTYNIVPDNVEFSIQIGGETAYTKGTAPDESLVTTNQMITGMKIGSAIEGSAARIFLTGISGRTTSNFIYYGGFVGQGNVTRFMDNIPYDANITEIIMELDVAEGFELFINNQSCGDFTPTAGTMTADTWDITNCSSLLIKGESVQNNFTIGFEDIDSKIFTTYIGGGYIKVKYRTSQIDADDYGINKYWFPDINGMVNLYTGVAVPGTIEKMKIKLHIEVNQTALNTSYPTFLLVGNETVYSKNESYLYEDIIIPDSNLSTILNYTALSNNTIPIRLGVENLSYELQEQKTSDIVLITDLSGSMESRMDSESPGVERNCSDPDLYNSSTKRVSLAKCLDKLFVDLILNNSDHNLGLAAFYGDTSPPHKGRVIDEDLTQNATYLKQAIDAYTPQGGTCICCAINDAYRILDEQGDPEKDKFIIVMSDGIPTHTCQAASGCYGTRTGEPSKEGLWLGGKCYGGLDDCDTNDCECAVNNTIWSAERANTNLNATIFSIGFGPVDTCPVANTTLRDTAEAGNGTYYASSNASALEDIYEEISEEINRLSRQSQAMGSTGELLVESRLYQDSYIEIRYDPNYNKTSYGEIPVTMQTAKFGTCYPQVTLPADMRIIEAKALSYSSEHWTDLVEINGWEMFNLSEYSQVYTSLGDPFAVEIMPDKLVEGAQNNLTIMTGDNATYKTNCSMNNSMVYTLMVSSSLTYDSVKELRQGCEWNVETETGSFLTIDVPTDYTGSNKCNYTSTDISYTTADAYDTIMYKLLDKLDLDDNGKIDIELDEENLGIDTLLTENIPYLWGPIMFEVRTWQ
jgi:hypothetical protein